jgi:hypothetical protein
VNGVNTSIGQGAIQGALGGATAVAATAIAFPDTDLNFQDVLVAGVAGGIGGAAGGYAGGNLNLNNPAANEAIVAATDTMVTEIVNGEGVDVSEVGESAAYSAGTAALGTVIPSPTPEPPPKEPEPELDSEEAQTYPADLPSPSTPQPLPQGQYRRSQRTGLWRLYRPGRRYTE